jgi:lipopolysaccharide transport system permease protein
VPEAWRTVYALNPMVGVVEGFRWALLGIGRPPDRLTVVVSAGVAVAVLVTGAFFFRRVERRFADII